MGLLVCPHCRVEMVQVKKEKVEIDLCPQCQGIWLDKGELEKVVKIAQEHLEQEVKTDSERIRRGRFWVGFFDIFK